MRSLALTTAAVLVVAAALGLERSPGGSPDAGAVNLVPNGDFERGAAGGPAGWHRPDRLSMFWVSGGPANSRKCMKFDTDIYLNEWEAHQANPTAGKTKTATKGPKYDTVAGTKGVHYRRSAKIPVKPKAYYLISVDGRGKATDFFFPKVFVKGYSVVRGEERETYNTYLACRVTGDRWMHFRRRDPFSPGRRSSTVKYMKVFIYTYWPPGVYHFDNLRIWEVKKDGSPVGAVSAAAAARGGEKAGDAPLGPREAYAEAAAWAKSHPEEPGAAIDRFRKIKKLCTGTRYYFMVTDQIARLERVRAGGE